METILNVQPRLITLSPSIIPEQVEKIQRKEIKDVKENLREPFFNFEMKIKTAFSKFLLWTHSPLAYKLKNNSRKIKSSRVIWLFLESDPNLIGEELCPVWVQWLASTAPTREALVIATLAK